MSRNKKRAVAVPAPARPANPVLSPATAIPDTKAFSLRHPGLLAAVLLVAATVLAYLPALDNGFVFDDEDYITHNPNVLGGLHPANIAWAFTTGRASNWHPLTWLSLQLDATLYGSEPWGYHVTNLGLHVANTLLVLLVLGRMTGAVWRSALVAGLFALHPLHVESVAWVTERKDVLSTLFGLLALWAYAAYVRRPALGCYLLVATAFGLSLLAKPMLVTLPCALLLLDFWPLRRLRLPGDAPNAGTVPLGRLLLEKVPLLLLAIASSVATWYFQQQGHSVQVLAQLPLTARLGNALVSYAAYLRKAVWPADLAAFYPHPGTALPPWQPAAAGLLLAAVTALAWRLRRPRPYLLVGWLWYVGTLVPVLGLVQVGSQALADRYTYVPLLGIFLMLAWALADLVTHRPVRERHLAAAGAVLVLFVCSLLTWLQVHYWHDEVALWTHALEAAPDNNAFAHTNLGTAIMLQARSVADEEDALAHFAEAVRLEPNQIAGNVSLGLLLEKRPGRLGEAIEHFRLVLRLQPDNVNAHLGLGSALALQNKFDEAESHLREVAEHLEPNSAKAHYLLGEVLQLNGKSAAAIAPYRKAVELRPKSVTYHCDLALALYDNGQKEEARQEYDKASRLDASWVEVVNHNARRLATDPDARSRNGPVAVKLARQACQATGEQEPRHLDTLAAAYAEAGRYDDAAAAARKALDLARARGPADLARHLEERLRRYQQHQPLREAPAPNP